MNTSELLEHIRKSHPALLADIPDPKAVRFVRACLSAIGETVESCKEGKVVVNGLGSFKVRMKEATEGGEAKRIVRFVQAKPKAKGEAEAE